jgi:hypothetical protein
MSAAFSDLLSSLPKYLCHLGMEIYKQTIRFLIGNTLKIFDWTFMGILKGIYGKVYIFKESNRFRRRWQIAAQHKEALKLWGFGRYIFGERGLTSSSTYTTVIN